MENLNSNQMAKIHLLDFSSEFSDLENKNLSKKLISELEEEGISISDLEVILNKSLEIKNS